MRLARLLATVLPRREPPDPVPTGRIFPLSSMTRTYWHVAELKIDARNQTEADKADAAARREIDREAKILSAWDSSRNSIVGREPLTGRCTFHLSCSRRSRSFDRWRKRTGGALDPPPKPWSASGRMASAKPRAFARRNRLRRESGWPAALASDPRRAVGDPSRLLAHRAEQFRKELHRRARRRCRARCSRGQLRAVNIGGDLVVRGPRPRRSISRPASTPRIALRWALSKSGTRYRYQR